MPDYWTFDPPVKAIRKGISVPRMPFGYGEYKVKDGDYILYREHYVGGGTGSRLARVLGRATHDPDGKPYGKKKVVLVVLAASDNFTHGYERWIDLGDVLEVRRPGTHSHGEFAKWFFTGQLASPGEVLRMVQYGAMKDEYIGEYLKNGKLQFDKKRVKHKVKGSNPKVKTKNATNVRSLVAKAMK